MQCLTASNASFLTTSATNQSPQSPTKSVRDSPRASNKLLKPPISHTSASPTRSFAVSAKLPETDIIYSASYNLIPVDEGNNQTNEQQDVMAGGDDVAPDNPVGLDLQGSEVIHLPNFKQKMGSPISSRLSLLSSVPSATPSSSFRPDWKGTWKRSMWTTKPWFGAALIASTPPSLRGLGSSKGTKKLRHAPGRATPCLNRCPLCPV